MDDLGLVISCQLMIVAVEVAEGRAHSDWSQMLGHLNLLATLDLRPILEEYRNKSNCFLF